MLNGSFDCDFNFFLFSSLCDYVLLLVNALKSIILIYWLILKCLTFSCTCGFTSRFIFFFLFGASDFVFLFFFPGHLLSSVCKVGVVPFFLLLRLGNYSSAMYGLIFYAFGYYGNFLDMVSS